MRIEGLGMKQAQSFQNVSSSTTSGSGLPAGVKQISSASNSTHYALVTYVEGGNSGSLKMAKFTNL